MKIALTIAGSDSGGGAGIQADLKTFHQYGVFGTTVVVAVTAQNTLGVRAVHAIPSAMIEAQLAALAEDLPPAGVKSGMLANGATVLLVAEALAAQRWRRYVCDPVMVSSSGDRLLAADAEEILRDRLVPLSALITPNLAEAAILTGVEVTDDDSMLRAGRRLLELGAGAALIKGGHLERETLVDLLVTTTGVRRFAHPRLPALGHGTGCTLSAAVTAQLALGLQLEPAVEQAIGFVQRALSAAPGLGRGIGPLNHSVTPG